MPTGVPAPYNQSMADLICALAAEGKLLNTIVNEVKLSRSTIHQWRRANPLFDRALAHAQEQGVHALVDESIAIADDRSVDPKRARNMIGARQWAAERRLRKDYGQSIDVSLTERVDIGGALIEARKRIVLPGSNLEQITDAQVIDVSPHNTMRAKDEETAAHVPVVNPFD